jgi:hypothetical protein
VESLFFCPRSLANGSPPRLVSSLTVLEHALHVGPILCNALRQRPKALHEADAIGLQHPRSGFRSPVQVYHASYAEQQSQKQTDRMRIGLGFMGTENENKYRNANEPMISPECQLFRWMLLVHAFSNSAKQNMQWTCDNCIGHGWARRCCSLERPLPTEVALLHGICSPCNQVSDHEPSSSSG